MRSVSFISWLHERELVQSGVAQQQLSDLKDEVNAAHEAIKIRESQRIADERNGVPVNDEFDRDKSALSFCDGARPVTYSSKHDTRDDLTSSSIKCSLEEVYCRGNK
jgi:hypothetical protein